MLIKYLISLTLVGFVFAGTLYREDVLSESLLEWEKCNENVQVTDRFRRSPVKDKMKNSENKVIPPARDMTGSKLELSGDREKIGFQTGILPPKNSKKCRR